MAEPPAKRQKLDDDEKKEKTGFPHKCKMTDGNLDCEGRVLLRLACVESDFNTYLMVPRETFFADMATLATFSNINTDAMVARFRDGRWYGKVGSTGHQFKTQIEKWQRLGHTSREYHYSSYANVSFLFHGRCDSEDIDDDDD